MAPKISNPRKQFRFSISILSPQGALEEPYLVQDVAHPETTIEQDTHGDVNYDIKTAGRVGFGNATLNKIMTANGKDNYFWNWLTSCQTAGLGGYVPNDYKHDIVVNEFGPGSDANIINTWKWVGCWPTKINGQTNNRQESGNTMESIEISVDDVIKV